MAVPPRIEPPSRQAPRVVALVPAAGLGLRMGGTVRKQYRSLGGVPLVVHSLRTLQSSPLIDTIVLAVPLPDIDYARSDVVERHRIAKVSNIVAGGGERQDSVRNALSMVEKSVEIVVVHDAVRPFLTETMLVDVIAAARKTGAAIVALPMRDTVKQVRGDYIIEQTIDRRPLWLAQTPQAFRRDWLQEAHQKAYDERVVATDDAYLVERLGHPVSVVEGTGENIKVTRPEDMILANAIHEARQITAERGY